MKHLRTVCFALVVSITGLTVITYVHHTRSQQLEELDTLSHLFGL